jgi:hypothetical protein
LLEYPFGNRAAEARLKRRRLELRQLTNQLEATTANVRLEVETAVREVTTAHREMISHYHAILGGEAEIEHLERRWRLLPGDQPAAGIVLDDLLNAQERLARAEASYADTLVAYNVALVQLKRATGVLLQCQPLNAAAHLPARGAEPARTRANTVVSTARRDERTHESDTAARPTVATLKKTERGVSVVDKTAAPSFKWPAIRKSQSGAAWPDRTAEVRQEKSRTLLWPARPDIAPDGLSELSKVTLPVDPAEEAHPLPAVAGPQLLPPVTEQ